MLSDYNPSESESVSMNDDDTSLDHICWNSIYISTKFWQVSETWATLLHMRPIYSENIIKIERGILKLGQILYLFTKQNFIRVIF